MEEKQKKKDNTGAFIFVAVLAGFAGYKIGSRHMVGKFKKTYDVIRFVNGNNEKIFFYYDKKQKALVEDFCMDHAMMRRALANKEGK